MNIEGVKAVTLGGGTGSFMLLNGLKNYVSHITAVVNMIDDGGSTGVLRDEYGALPPGDIRQCLVALSKSSVIRELFSYRYTDGQLSGHSFGNLFLSTLEKVTGSFSDAVSAAAEVLAIEGEVLPVTLSDTKLKYMSPNGQEIIGENKIGDTDALSQDMQPNLSLTNRALINPKARKAILQADLIIMAPGTLYGSLAPILMVEGVSDALIESKAKKIYVANLMATPEILGYTAADVYKELVRFAGGKDFIEHVIVNNAEVPKKAINYYEADNQTLLELGMFEGFDTEIHYADVLHTVADTDEPLIRHDPDKVAREIMKLYFS